MPKLVRTAARELALVLLVVSLSVGMAAAQGAGNGLLGIYFDTNGSKCEGTIAQGGLTTLYVLLGADGDTRGGIQGAEFRVEVSGSGYRLFGEQILFPDHSSVGKALEGGITVAPKMCQSGGVIPILSFQVQNVGGGNDAVVSVTARSSPTNPNFACALVNLCDGPDFTKICVRPGKAVLNPTGSIACGSGASASEWSRVKELYR